MHEVNLKLVIATARIYNVMFSKLEKNIQEYGLNISEFGVLEMLFHKGEQPVQKIAEKILVTSGTVTYVIDKLVKKELVYRRKCDKDKRIFYVCLTAKGEELISQVFPKHKDFLDDIFSGVDDEFKHRLIADLFTLQDTLNHE
jgi:MarR family 2-MHQ and catechol resistance regulon transcriptional repressor